MHSGVVSGVPVMFERPANRLSGFKEQEGGALSPQNQVSDQVESFSFKATDSDRLVVLRACAQSTSIIILAVVDSGIFV